LDLAGAEGVGQETGEGARLVEEVNLCLVKSRHLAADYETEPILGWNNKIIEKEVIYYA